MKPVFAVQVTGRQDSDLHKTFDAIKSIGYDAIDFGVIPFENTVTNVEAFPRHTPIIVLGGTKCVDLFVQCKLPPWWRVWYDARFFDQRVYSEKFGTALLNYLAIYEFYGIVKNALYGRSMFVKPVNDLKAFAGLVLEPRQTLDEALQKQTHQPIADEQMVLLSPVQKIGREWRVFLLRGKAITGSQYKDRERVAHKAMTETEWEVVSQFCEALHDPYFDHVVPIYTMDVCETEGGLRIVELNCFNCSGMYESDRALLLRTVAEQFE
jgi:hypothetical protein